MNTTREMFARGYALATASHPVGVTERARRACLAAESAPAPDGLPSLVIGQLEGIWAVIYDRREALEKLHAGSFKKVLEAIAALDWGPVVDSIQTQLLIDPNISGAALTAVIRTKIVDTITADLPADVRSSWNTLMQDAILDGTVEGQVAAQAILQGSPIDWELAAEKAKAALGRGTALGEEAERWVQRQVQGLGYQLSQQLAALWNQGASKQEMLAIIRSTLGTSNTIAARLLDTSIGHALSQGSLDTYAAAGVEKADFVTAGDQQVCAVCAQAEDEGPYRLEACPQPPMHVSCRCTVAPSDSSFSLLAAS